MIILEEVDEDGQNDGDDDGEEGNGAVLALEIGERPFENAVGDVPHFRGARIFSHHIASQIDRENDRNDANDDHWREIRTDIVQVLLLDSRMREPASAESRGALPRYTQKWLFAARFESADRRVTPRLMQPFRVECPRHFSDPARPRSLTTVITLCRNRYPVTAGDFPFATA